MSRKVEGWEITAGIYPGILIGVRTYRYRYSNEHVLYIPFIEFALTVHYDD